MNRQPVMREEMRRCGNPVCKCHRTKDKTRWHGPYLYLYFWDPVRRQSRKKYIGPAPPKSANRLAWEEDIRRGVGRCKNCKEDCIQRKRLQTHFPRAGEDPDVKWCYCGCNNPEPEPFEDEPDPPKEGDRQRGPQTRLGSSQFYDDFFDKQRTKTAIKAKQKWRNPLWWGAAETGRRLRERDWGTEDE